MLRRRASVSPVPPLTVAVSQAHWFYEDFCRESPEGRNFRGFSLRDFAAVMFSQHPSLAQHKVRHALWSPRLRRTCRAALTRTRRVCRTTRTTSSSAS